MSVKVYKTQTYRPYKIEVYGLQDDYIGTLQSYDDSFLGRVQDPKVSISGDGSQEFTCSVPRFYINPKTNEKLINPRWGDIINGVLAENTRVLKVFVETDGEKKVYPFIVDKIVDKRDSHFSVFKEITGNGLAFAELGKVGLKLELNSRTVELEQEANKDKEIVPTLQYWLDKVFPRDESGRWLTPWCYEIRMDWSQYSDKENRLPTKVYSDAYVNNWTIEGNELVPSTIQSCQEKARMIDCSENGNKYNITQTLAETFGVFCNYEYKCAENGSFIKEYTDEKGNVWQGRKVIFYNRAIKTDKPFMIEYQKNLQSISRTCETDEIYSKLYVTPIESSVMTDGYVTIANTEANPLLDEFILNFDYLYEKGAINDYQKECIANYETEMHASNVALLELSKEIEEITVEINDKKAEEAGYEKSISAAKEQLVYYETVRDNEVTNTPVVKDGSNSCFVIFVTSGETTEAKIKLEGVACGTISGYSDSKYEKKLFGAENLVIMREKRPIAAGDTNIYVLVDEYGYADVLYTAKANLEQGDSISEGPNSGFRVYLTLEYSRYNKYVDICKRFENIIDKETQKKEEANSIIKEKENLLDFYTTLQNNHIKQKELLNQKLEKLLGPALREGYWTPNGYEEIGKRKEVELKIEEEPEETEERFFFDTELFEEEESGFYYASKEAFTEDEKTYFPYIDISDYIDVWDDSSYGNLVLHLQNPSFKYVAQASNALAAGDYFFIHEAVKYYFKLQSSLKENDILEIKFSLEESNPELILTQNGTITVIPVSIEEPKDVVPSNVTNIFEGISQYLGDYKIYPNAGFIYAFIKRNGKVIPVLLLNNDEIHYDVYKQIAYSFTNNDDKGIFSDTIYSSFEICYPRIAIMKENVNYESDLLSIKNNGNLLTKFEDYSILTRKRYPYFTIKINNNNSVKAILNNFYSLVYYTSQANEILYQDAKEVAKENSRPRFSYSVQVSQVPSNIESFELGQLGYISDSELGVHAAQGYISQIVLQLDSPKDDEITIQNYKTKFEDLFSTITASSEAMKTNQHSYDIAASGFTSKGEIDGSILQDTFDNNKIELTYSNTNVHIDDLDGIVLTNTEPYTNGVYGQVVLRGGGIFLSNTVDSNEKRIWTTGITPNGINASTITTGQLDANLVRIFAGNNLAFQWNSEGLYAYKRDEETNSYLPNTYVRYSDKGLQYLDNGFVAVDLGWNGLEINSQEGALSLTGKDGLVLYEGSKNIHATNHVVKLGRFGTEEDNYSYGMRLYKKTEEIDNDGCHYYTETLTTTNDGQLWLKDYLVIGSDKIIDSNDALGAGISGVNSEVIDDSVRFWAGSTFTNRAEAPFRVLHDGTTIATKIFVGKDSQIADGLITTKAIAAEAITADLIKTDAVTADKIAANTITADKIATDFDLEIGAGRSINITTDGIFTVASDNFTITDEGNVSLTGEITAESGSIGGWNIDEYGLYSGEGNNYVALSSEANQAYSIWAGAEDPSKAAFAVTKEGHVYLEKVYVQTDIDDNGNPIYATKSLTEYPLWAIWPAYNGRIIEVTSSEKNGQITLTFNRSQGDPLTVNFKKAAVTSSNYNIRFSSGEGTGFSANLIENSSSESTGISAYANLSIDVNGAQSMARVIPQQASGPVAEASLENVYNAGWAAAEEQVKWPSGSQETSFEISVPSTEVGKITTRTFIMTKGSNPNAEEGYASVIYDNSLIARIPINDWYVTGVNSVGFVTSQIKWENGAATIRLTNGESKSIGAPNNCTITGPKSWTADHKGKVYVVHGSSGPLGDGDVDASSVYEAGYDAAKKDAKIKYNGTEQARVIESGSTKVTIVNDSGIMITGTFVRGGTLKTYNTGAYIAYE